MALWKSRWWQAYLHCYGFSPENQFMTLGQLAPYLPVTARCQEFKRNMELGWMIYYMLSLHLKD